jgi:hypothetical protein
MAGEHSPVPEEVVGGEAEVPRPEVTMTDSSSGEDTSDRSRDDTSDQDEGSGAVDPRESSRSYNFGPSTVTVGRIRQLEALGYFAEGSAREPGEEVILKPAADEAIMFEEFCAAGLWMPPHPALTDILVMFHVQLHQLMPNAFAQFSKYILVVMSFGGKPSDDDFAKCYKLHYQLKEVGGDRANLAA